MKSQNPSTSLGEGRGNCPLPSRTHPQEQNLVVYTEELTHLKLRDAVRLGRGTEVVLFENSLRRHFWNETQIAVDVVSICVADKASFALQAPDR
jgi:hypothetical protein